MPRLLQMTLISLLMIAACLAVGALFLSLAGDADLGSGFPDWMRVQKPATAAYLQATGEDGKRLALRVGAGLFFLAGAGMTLAMTLEWIDAARSARAPDRPPRARKRGPRS